jgi:hypothetical protein
MSTVILDSELDLDVPSISHRHDGRFVEVIGVTDLWHFLRNKIRLEQMDALTRILNSRVVSSREVRDVIWVFVFANGPDCSEDSLPMGSTHAVSVFSRTPDGMTHRYFERAGGGFREIGDLEVAVTSVPNLDIIRLLHFGAFAFGELPAQSAIYEFKANVWDIEDTLQRSDHTLRTALLLDAEKIAGAPAIGLHGHEVYTALLRRDDHGVTHCGNDTGCPEGTLDCVPVPPRDSAGYTCGEDDGGDAWVSVFTRAIQAGLVSLDDVDFPAARTFITDFLPQTPRGRQLMAHYYAASPLVRRDRTALEEYVRLLPSIRAGLRNLLYGADDATVVSDDARDAWARLAALNRDVRLPAVALSASEVRHQDWARLTTKADVLRMLEG